MKFLVLATALSIFAASAYSAQSESKKSSKRSGFVENRQNTAREIMKDNFNSPEASEKKQKSNFGFHKKKKESAQKI